MVKSKVEQKEQEWHMREKAQQLHSELVLPDFDEWKDFWKCWIDEFISEKTLYGQVWKQECFCNSDNHEHSDLKHIERITPENIQKLIETNLDSVLEWATAGEWRGLNGNRGYLTCQDYLELEASNAFLEFVIPQNQFLLELLYNESSDSINTNVSKHDTPDINDLTDVFENYFFDVYVQYVENVLEDYSEDDFVTAFLRRTGEE